LSDIQVATPDTAVASPPRHVAIIMDGNGRWAKARGLPRVVGHRRGAEAVRETVMGCRELGVGFLTLYAFSSENWKRPASEVGDLMDLLRFFIRRELDELDRNGVRIRVIGERSRLADDIVGLISEAEERTRRNRVLTLVIALNYGGQNEIIAACRALATEAAAGRLDPAKIDGEMFAAHLQTAGIPDPDLLIRTSGEQRLSNFLLWQSAYTELVFTDVLWPDFTRHHLADALAQFQRRERRYGASD
jgi:undecaprenyl diphosphate synthase